MACTPSGPFSRDPCRERDRLVEHLVGRDDAVHQSEREGACRVDAVAGEPDLECERERDEASEHDSPAAGEESALDLRETELGLIGSNHEIAREEELQAAPDGGRVRRADDRLHASAA